eukprot:3828278-Prymnesium_polylepis.1
MALQGLSRGSLEEVPEPRVPRGGLRGRARAALFDSAHRDRAEARPGRGHQVGGRRPLHIDVRRPHDREAQAQGPLARPLAPPTCSSLACHVDLNHLDPHRQSLPAPL